MYLFKIGLPKWPGLLVVGESVTKEQAQEILIRTSSLGHFCSNDREFESQINDILFGVYASFFDLDRYLDGRFEKDFNARYRWIEKQLEPYKVLDLHYLKNHQILSSYIGGPHGWCNWDGNIGTSSYNIGKWPDVEEVFNEWKIIAEAFPYLNLKSQLWSGETCEPNTQPLVQFDIFNGGVTLSTPARLGYLTDTVMRDIFNNNTERGCTIEQFKAALEYTKQQNK